MKHDLKGKCFADVNELNCRTEGLKQRQTFPELFSAVKNIETSDQS